MEAAEVVIEEGFLQESTFTYHSAGHHWLYKFSNGEVCTYAEKKGAVVVLKGFRISHLRLTADAAISVDFSGEDFYSGDVRQYMVFNTRREFRWCFHSPSPPSPGFCLDTNSRCQ